MNALYNEIEEYPARWLDELVDAGHINPGDVDTRSIVDLEPSDVADYTQFHAFAGIGVWSYALRLAGWPDDAPVWTGSCPCQPFSVAGKQRGNDDERHLFPAWLDLIEECRPPVIFGEQVASPSGREWLDAVQSELEALGYAVGAADLSAASVGAPHIRSRLWFGAIRMADPGVPRLEGHAGDVGRLDEQGRVDTHTPGAVTETRGVDLLESEFPGSASFRRCYDTDNPGPWRSDWLLCRDPGFPKWRPVETGTFPLAHGTANRVGRLRAYGNAIVPQVAATFIQSFVEAL